MRLRQRLLAVLGLDLLLGQHAERFGVSKTGLGQYWNSVSASALTLAVSPFEVRLDPGRLRLRQRLRLDPGRLRLDPGLDLLLGQHAERFGVPTVCNPQVWVSIGIQCFFSIATPSRLLQSLMD